MEYTTVELHFEEHGQGVPVILIHGYPLDHTIWKPVVNQLKPFARLIVPDLRGYGASPDSDGEWSIREMADDIHDMMHHLDVKRAVLVGHSMGGYIALAFAHAYPAHTAGLGLVATQAAADTPEKRQARYIQIEEVKRRGVKHVVEHMAPKITPRPALAEALKLLMVKTRLSTVVNSLKAMAERPDATEWLNLMDIPAVVIAGKADTFIPLERAQTMAQILPRGWMVEIPDAGHMPMLETPELVADALRQLIEACGSPSNGKTS